MSEPEKHESTELPVTPAPEPEITEENFVPDFNLEYEQEKLRKKRILLLVLLCVAVLLGAYLIFGKRYNFYKRVMNSLGFDYRVGETIDTSLSAMEGNAARIENTVAGREITVKANVYCFNSSGALSLTASRYEYTRSGSGEAELHVQSGAEDTVRTAKSTYHADAAGNVTQTEGDFSQVADEIAVSLLYDFCFTAKPHGDLTAECSEVYYTQVGGNQYTCEVWLISVPVNHVTKYYTLYRYYSGGELNAVRMVTKSSDLMFVYDITEY